MTLVLLLSAACALGAVYAVTLAPRRALRSSLGRASSYGRGLPASPAPSPLRAVLAPGLSAAARAYPRRARDRAADRLAAAGLARRLPLEAYLAARIAAALLGGGAGLVFVASGGRPGMGAAAGLLLAAAGFLLPDSVLRARARMRVESILVTLPNALDLLAVSVEAGAGLDGAIVRYARTARGPLADEFGRVIAELQVGAARADVMQRLADRVPAPEMAAFVRSVSHAERLGTSLTGTLRTQAADARRTRQARAEERANKLPVKMLFPTVFFIFPALFVVVLGPAVLHILDVLGHHG